MSSCCSLISGVIQEFRKFIHSVLNREELLQQRKACDTVPPYTQDDKINGNKYV
jgi:hypothetical protein